MRKNENSISDIFVKKIVEKGKKLFTKKEILQIWVRSGGSQSREAYAISLLMGRNILQRVARDVYIRTGETIDVSYWDIVAELVDIHAPSGAVIGGEKSLELHMMNYAIPDTLVLYTRISNIRVRLSDGRSVHFRTLFSGEKTGRKNLFSLLSRFSEKREALGDVLLPCREIALLEALSLREHDVGVSDVAIARFLDREHVRLQEDIFLSVIRYRYIRAINRLREIARDRGYNELYESTLMAIKREGGGCFVTS